MSRHARLSQAEDTAAEWLDVAHAAQLHGLTEKALRARIARHQVPFRRLGSRVIFNKSELHEFFDKLHGVGVGEALANATRAGERHA